MGKPLNRNRDRLLSEAEALTQRACALLDQVEVLLREADEKIEQAQSTPVAVYPFMPAGIEFKHPKGGGGS